jgi:pimeloyl-ACP methyl ester carboxylesterase
VERNRAKRSNRVGLSTVMLATLGGIGASTRVNTANLSPFRGQPEKDRFIAKYESVLSNWPVHREELHVSTDFGQTHIVVSGAVSAPPLVLLHGANTTSAMWSPIIATLSGSYRCYCIDTITEANKSLATHLIRDVADYVDWLQQTFSALGIEKARVAGFSYGGWLAALLALHAPERVSHLSLLSPAATLDRVPVQFMARLLSPGLLRSRSLAARFLQWMSATPDATLDPSMALIVESLMACRPLRREIVAPTVLTDDELSRISAPVCVLIGDQDVVYRAGPEAAAARARRHIPNVHTRILPGANHFQTLDCPDLLVTEMLAAIS